MKCYILGAVTGSAENAKEIFNIYKSALENKFEILGTPLETAEFKGNFEERFKRAKNFVKKADVIIAEVSTASTGAGIELGMAHLLNKNIYCFANEDSKVSGLLIGMVGNNKVICYKDEKDLYEILKNFKFQ